jgi:hypothetical protein
MGSEFHPVGFEVGLIGPEDGEAMVEILLGDAPDVLVLVLVLDLSNEPIAKGLDRVGEYRDSVCDPVSDLDFVVDFGKWKDLLEFQASHRFQAPVDIGFAGTVCTTPMEEVPSDQLPPIVVPGPYAEMAATLRAGNRLIVVHIEG